MQRLLPYPKHDLSFSVYGIGRLSIMSLKARDMGEKDAKNKVWSFSIVLNNFLFSTFLSSVFEKLFSMLLSFSFFHGTGKKVIKSYFLSFYIFLPLWGSTSYFFLFTWISCLGRKNYYFPSVCPR